MEAVCVAEPGSLDERDFPRLVLEPRARAEPAAEPTGFFESERNSGGGDVARDSGEDDGGSPTGSQAGQKAKTEQSDRVRRPVRGVS